MLLFLSFTPESLGSPPSCVPKEQKAPLLFLLFYALVPKEPLSSRRFYLLFRRNKRDERGSSVSYGNTWNQEGCAATPEGADELFSLRSREAGSLWEKWLRPEALFARRALRGKRSGQSWGKAKILTDPAAPRAKAFFPKGKMGGLGVNLK